MSNLLELPQTLPAGGGTDDGDDLVHLRCMNCSISPCGLELSEDGDLDDTAGEIKCIVCYTLWSVGMEAAPCARCGL